MSDESVERAAREAKARTERNMEIVRRTLAKRDEAAKAAAEAVSNNE
jgi:hypothetical protein